jgi:hypothetical protein
VDVSSNNAAPATAVGILDRSVHCTFQNDIGDALDICAVEVQRWRGCQDLNGVLLAVARTATVIVEKYPITPTVQEQV